MAQSVSVWHMIRYLLTLSLSISLLLSSYSPGVAQEQPPSTASTPQSSAPSASSSPAAPSAPANSSTSSAAEPAAPPVPADSDKLELVKAVKAIYPMRAEDERLQGQVWIMFSISETGDVAKAEVISGDPVLAPAALDAAKKWKFKPYIRNGKPIPVRIKLPFDFVMHGSVTDVRDKSASTTIAVSGQSATADSTGDQPQASGSQADQSSTKAGSAGATGPQRVRVAQGVSNGLLLHKVAPTYPESARMARIQGTVVLQAEISKEGRVVNLMVISGPKELTQSAIGAVEQWRYRPYMLNGNPVAVETQVIVNYILQ